MAEQQDDIIAGLDIGTTKVCAVIGQIRENGLEIIGAGAAPSFGLRKGIIVNIDATVAAITKAIQDAEIMAGVEVDSVYAGIGGSSMRGINSRGMVAISSKNREISQADVGRAVEASKAVAIPPDREIVHIFTQEYKVDDQDGIREPIGMTAGRLEVEAHIVTSAVTTSENVIKSINRAGYKVNDIVFQAYASALAVLGEAEKEMGVVLADFGGGTIDLIMYINGSIWHTSVLAVGGNNITNDITVGLRAPTLFAEDIKMKYAIACQEAIQQDSQIEIPVKTGRDTHNVNIKDLIDIVEPRVAEIFSMIKKDIDSTGFTDLVSGGIVVTGGGALLKGLETLGERIMGMPVRMGFPQNLLGMTEAVSQPSFSTAAGLVLYGYQKVSQPQLFEDNRDKGVLKKSVNGFVKWFKDNF